MSCPWDKSHTWALPWALLIGVLAPNTSCIFTERVEFLLFPHLPPPSACKCRHVMCFLEWFSQPSLVFPMCKSPSPSHICGWTLRVDIAGIKAVVPSVRYRVPARPCCVGRCFLCWDVSLIYDLWSIDAPCCPEMEFQKYVGCARVGPSLSPGMAFGVDVFKPALFVFLWV